MGDTKDTDSAPVVDENQQDFFEALGLEKPQPSNGHANGHANTSSDINVEIQSPTDVTDDPAAEVRRLSRLSPLEYGQCRKEVAKRLGISATLLDAEVKRTRRAPAAVNGTHANLLLAPSGLPLPVFTNAAEIIRAYPGKWPLRFDEFSQRPYLADVALDDATLQGIAEWVQRQGVLAPRAVISDAVAYVAQANKFHAVRDWLDTLAWDETPRLDMLLIDHADAEDTALTRAFTRKWFIQAVARVYEPGCQADATLMLEGSQDLGKSTFFRVVFGDDWFTDHLPNLDNKDAMIQLLGIWCIEISELAAVSRQDNAKVKQFLTSRDDRFRMPWDRLAQNHPRQSVFAATVNPSGRGHLTDETGGRRWWPVAVNRMDIELIRENREQLWAEAVVRFKRKEAWYLAESELKEAAKLAQAERYISDIWHDDIVAFTEGKSFVTIPHVLTHCIGLYKKSDWGQSEENRVSRCLRHLGWARRQRRVEEGQRWGYLRPGTGADVQLSPVRNASGDITGYRQHSDVYE